MKTAPPSRFLPPGRRTCYLHAKSRLWTPALPMTSRIRLLITAAVLCHLLLAPRLVTSQLLPTSPPQKNLRPVPAKRSEPVSISAVHQEKDGEIYKLQGNVEIDDGIFSFRGDQVTYDSDSGNIQAEGHLLLEGGPNHEHIEAARGTYNINTEIGHFEIVTGSIGVETSKNRTVFTTSNPFYFTGKVVDKKGPEHYVVADGSVTSCQLPRPKWQFFAHKVVVEAGGNATIYHSNFRIEGVPILYLPFATHPVQKEPRQSGFLLPNVGRSSTRGNTIGESIFWAINRSMDLLAGTEYFSKRGWAPEGEFRARPTETSFVDLTAFSVFDRGLNGVNQGGTEAHLNAEGAFAHNFRAVADLDYLSSYVFRLAFSDVFTQAVNSEVKSNAFLSNTTGNLFLNAAVRRYQDFQSTTPGDVITILHAPAFEVSSLDRPLFNSPLHGTIDAWVGGLSRSEPGFSTAPLVGRFDLDPVVSLPLILKNWGVRPEFSFRETFYTQQLVPSGGVALTDVGTAISDGINRKALTAAVEIRPPALDRVYDREIFGRKWKHVIEPRITYTYVTGVENFAHILRFDDRDILTDTNEVEYAVVNRLYAKRTSQEPEGCGPEGMPALMVGIAPPSGRAPWQHTQRTAELPCPKQPAVREIVTWELAQKYFVDPTFGGALVPGRLNVFTSTVDLTGIAFLTEARRLSPLISRLRISTGPRNDVSWDLEYDFKDGRISTSTALFDQHFGAFTVGVGNAFLNVPSDVTSTGTTPPPQVFNQFRAVLGYGNTNKRGFSSAMNLGFDAELNQVQYGSGQLAYNWDCCGVNVEYRRFALASVRNENQFRFSFVLANVGAFGNLRRTERLF
jgi:LPS-assembly protein